MSELHKQCNHAALSLQDLREDLQQFISLEDIGALVVKNPHTAKNELRAACRRVFVQGRWLPVPSAHKQKLLNQLIDVVFGLGPIEALIDDESVTEIMINGAKEVYFERGGRLERSGLAFESDDQVRVLIDRIVGPLGRRIDESSPLVNARLPQGHRVHAVIPPIAPDGPHLTIRAFGKRSLTLGEMSQAGAISTGVACYLSWLVRMRKNIVVSGGTGSGKTTMLNALSYLIDPSERVLTIEDSAELKLSPKAHVVRLEARPKNAEGLGEITIRELVINALRMRPDRIVVGECRGAEAWDMLQAMTTGHDGSLTTLHANSPEEVVGRMVTMVRYAADLPVDSIESQIASAFDVVIQVTRDAHGKRFVSTLAEVDFNSERRTCAIAPVYLRSTFDAAGNWVQRPKLIDELYELAENNEALRKEVSQWEQLELSACAA